MMALVSETQKMPNLDLCTRFPGMIPYTCLLGSEVLHYKAIAISQITIFNNV